MNLRVVSNGLPGSFDGRDKRVCGLCENFFPEMASPTTFDGVQVLVNPGGVYRSNQA